MGLPLLSFTVTSSTTNWVPVVKVATAPAAGAFVPGAFCGGAFGGGGACCPLAEIKIRSSDTKQSTIFTGTSAYRRTSILKT